MKPGAKAFGMMGIIICVACCLVVLWGCGGGGKVAKRGDAAAGQGEPADGSFTDPRDNQTYRTVRIGNRTWMAENLNHQTNDSWCYGNQRSNCDKYGRLYTWDAAMSACSGLGGGWRLPSDDDWNALISAVGGNNVAGTKLKPKTGWAVNGHGADDFGFSALPGGRRGSDGSFSVVGRYGHWWSATENGSDYAWLRYMYYDDGNVVRNDWNKAAALSVRCVRDTSGLR